MTKEEAWKAWCEVAGTADLATEFTLEQSSHGKAFSFAWDAAQERNKMAAWMVDGGYATGHGDTVEDLLMELEWQIRESERDRICTMLDDLHKQEERHNYYGFIRNMIKEMK